MVREMQERCTKERGELPTCQEIGYEEERQSRRVLGSFKVMKNDTAIKVFASAVKAKVERADAMGTKTSWTTEDHLKALAETLAQTDVPTGEGQPAGIFYEILADGYNISAFQQALEKIPAYAAKGHFQRTEKKGAKSANALYAALGV